MTTRALMRTVALAKLGYPGLYVLPDDAFRSDFMRERFNPIVQHNPDWRTNIGSAYKNADAMSVKHLWGIPWKFVGARNKKNFFSFTAAAAIVDEYDLCNQSNLGFLEDRFGRQDKVFFYRFGNPGLPGQGINAEIERTDCKLWLIKCQACNHWQELDWYQNVVRQVDDGRFELRDPRYPLSTDSTMLDFEDESIEAEVYCCKCHKPIDRLARGYWVPKYQGRIRSGYKISQLFGRVSRRAVVLELFFGRKGFLESIGDMDLFQRFHNNALGVPHRPPGSAISEELLDRCIAREGDIWEPFSVCDLPILDEKKRRPIETSGGLDINPGYGHVLHVEQLDFDGNRRKLATLRCRNWEEIQDAVKLWNVQTGVCDINPEREASRTFVENNPGWYTCEFTNGNIQGPYKIDHANQAIQANKTVTLDRSYRDFQTRTVLLARDYRNYHPDFVDQMTASVRKLVQVQGKLLTKVVAVWDEGSARDDDRLADAYCKINASIYAGEPILEAA